MVTAAFYDFWLVNRLSLHIIFWLLYIIEDTILLFTWNAPLLSGFSNQSMIWMSAQACVVYLVPKILITYYVLNVSIRKVLLGNAGILRIIVEIIIALVVTIALYRALAIYFIRPFIFDDQLRHTGMFHLTSILVALMDIGAVLGLAATLKVVRIQLAAKEREKDLVKQKLGTELKFLRNQTNPHFLMNTLNNIYALARKKSDDTAEVVMKLSELLRFMLYESNEPRILLSEEVRVLEDYLELEKMRYNNRLSVNFRKEIDSGSYRITPLLLLPFVENAFKHGISETRFESFVDISLVAKDGIFLFAISNSKDGSRAVNGTSNSIGLTNVIRQLELMYRDHHLDVENNADRFSVRLHIKLDSYAEI